MNYEITLKPTRTFEVFAGEKSLGTFRLCSEWNGLAQLRDEKGQTIIINREEAFSHMLANLFGGGSEKVKVIKASPDIGAAITEANQ